MIDAIPLDTGHGRARYINERSLVFNTFKPCFYHDFEEFIIPDRGIIMNNKQKSNKKRMVRRKKIRTKEEFIAEIKRLSEIDDNYRNYSYLRQIKRSDLLYESVVLFGGWRKAIEAAGFRPIQKSWTKWEIIENIKQIIFENGCIPYCKNLTKLGYPGLYRSVERKFGNWSNALAAAGFNAVRKKWTEENAIKQLRELSVKLGHSPSMNELKRLGKFDLLNIGLKFFGKYNTFLKAAGLDIVLAMNKWPKEKIISELREIADELGRTPRKSELAAMKKYDLINAAETYFHCWSDALIAADLVPNSDVLNDDKTWRDWENLIFEILSKKCIIYDKKKYIKKVGYPDVYIPSQDKMIEIKLNCSDNSVKTDIQKYLPHCNTLEVWYLYGKPFGILSNKITFVGPNRIKKMIENDGLLLDRFKHINRGKRM